MSRYSISWRLFRYGVGVAAFALLLPMSDQAVAQAVSPVDGKPGFAPPDSLSWAKPVFPTKPPVDKVITTVDTYNYVESTYAPSVRIEPIPQNTTSHTTPETATVAQFSAMFNEDLDWFAKTWTEAAWAETEAYNTASGHSPKDITQRWRAAFRVSRPLLLRRIDTGPYTILTYKLVAQDGTLVVDMEMPLILENESGRWLATQALRKDPFPSLSPWVTGETEFEATVQ